MIKKTNYDSRGSKSEEKLSDLLKAESNRVSTQCSTVMPYPPNSPAFENPSSRVSQDKISSHFRKQSKGGADKEKKYNASTDLSQLFQRKHKQLTPAQQQAIFIKPPTEFKRFLAKENAASSSTPNLDTKKFPEITRSQFKSETKKGTPLLLKPKLKQNFIQDSKSRPLSPQPLPPPPPPQQQQNYSHLLSPNPRTNCESTAHRSSERNLTQIESGDSSSLSSPSFSMISGPDNERNNISNLHLQSVSSEEDLLPMRGIEREALKLSQQPLQLSEEAQDRMLRIYDSYGFDSEFERVIKKTPNINQKTKAQFLEKQKKKIRRASKFGALGQNPISIIFSDLRHKLLNNIGVGNKLKNLQKMPQWVLDNPDYREISEEHSKKRSVFQICKRTSMNRSQKQTAILKEYLQKNVGYFESIPGPQIEKIADKLISQFFDVGQTVFLQGSIGNKMFIIVQGVVEVIFDQSKVAELKKNQVFGETALTLNAPRGATIRAVEQTQCLALKKEDYESAIIFVKRLEKLENERFVQAQNIISHWSQTKKQNFTFNIESRRYKSGEVIFEQGDPAKVFYILKEGKLQIEMGLDIQSNNKYPINKQSWEVLKTTKRILHFLKNIYPGQHFGHQEMLDGNLLRKRRVSAVEDSEVIYVKQNIFQKCKDDVMSLVFNEKQDQNKLTSPDLLNINKIKHEIVKGLAEKKFTKSTNFKPFEKKATQVLRDAFVQRGSMHFGASRVSDASEPQTGKRASIVSAEPGLFQRTQTSNSPFQRSQSGFPMLKSFGKGFNIKGSAENLRRMSISKNPQIGINRTLKIVKETKIIKDFSEFLDSDGDFGKTGDLNVKIVENLHS